MSRSETGLQTSRNPCLFVQGVLNYEYTQEVQFDQKRVHVLFLSTLLNEAVATNFLSLLGRINYIFQLKIHGAT